MFGLGSLVPTTIDLIQGTDYDNENTVYAVKDGEKILAKQVLPKIKEDLKKLEKNKYLIKKLAVEKIILDGLRLAKPGEAVSAETVLKNIKIDWRIPMNFLEPAIKVDTGFLPPLITSKTKKSIIFFGNYHCANCPESYQKILALRQNLQDKVNVYFRFAFTETDNPIIYQSALATVCSNEQGQFEKFFHIMFQAPPSDIQGLKASAEKANLNTESLTACMGSDEAKRLITADLKDAERLNIARQPVVFVNGHPIAIQEALENIEAFLAQP